MGTAGGGPLRPLCLLKNPDLIWKSQSKPIWPPTEVFALPRGCWLLYEPEQIDFCISVWSNGSSSFGLEGQCLSINLYWVQHEILYYIPPWLIFNKARVGSGNQVKPPLTFCPRSIFKNYDGIGLNITLQSFTCVRRFQTTNHFHTHVLF